MKVYELTEKMDDNQHAIHLKFASKPTSISLRLTHVNTRCFENAFNDLSKKHFHQFVDENYPNSNFSLSFKSGIVFSSANKECMEKVAKILITIHEQISGIYQKETRSDDVVTVNDFYKMLEPHFNSTILNETLNQTLPSNASGNKKRNKI